MKLEYILEYDEKIVMTENKSLIMKVLNDLGRMGWAQAKKHLRSEAMEFVSAIKDDPNAEKAVLRIVNKHLGTSFTNLNSIFGKALVEQTNRVDEGLKDWWKEASGNMYGALSFYPLLTAFLELDKVVKGAEGMDVKATMVYFLMWILIVTGKVLSTSVGKGDTKKVFHPSRAK